MIKTLKESKAKLSELVQLAAEGEEVVITVRGVPKARLCPMSRTADQVMEDRQAWGTVLREARETFSIGGSKSSEDILREQRADRL